MVYPKKMTPMLSRFEGYNVNSYKFHPMNVDSVTSGKIITMRMPSMALVDLKSFSMWFDAKANGEHLAGDSGSSARKSRVEFCGAGCECAPRHV